jgi:hypothetical protein
MTCRIHSAPPRIESREARSNVNGDKMADDLNRIRSFVDAVLERDGHDLEAVKSRARSRLQGDVELVPGAPERSEGSVLEAIISLHRPVFAIANDKVDPTLTSNQTDAEISAMAQLVADKATVINRIIPAVGCIDLPDDENYPWVGTGWSSTANLAMISLSPMPMSRSCSPKGRTRGSASSLYLSSSAWRRPSSISEGRSPTRRRAVSGFSTSSISARRDCLTSLSCGWRAAGMEFSPARSGLQWPIPSQICPSPPLGYPGTDRGHYDLATLLRVYGNVFDTKRCAPGRIVGMDSRGISHDCSTMPGSSGMVVFDVATGEAIGCGYPDHAYHRDKARL